MEAILKVQKLNRESISPDRCLTKANFTTGDVERNLLEVRMYGFLFFHCGSLYDDLRSSYV